MSLGIANHRKKDHEEIKKQIEEFLAKGGEIKQYATTERVRKIELGKGDRQNLNSTKL